MISYIETPIQRIQGKWLEKGQVKVFMKREDLNHPLISGNKWWKLKYNLEEARRQGFKKLLTFGGAFSNHIFATSAAARECGFDSIGVIRGEETFPLNATLSFARMQGMKLHYVSRETYRQKSDTPFIETLRSLFGEFYLIPEGGTNSLAIKGCEEFGKKIIRESAFDFLCLPVGTSGTMAGLAIATAGKPQLIGFSALNNGAFLNEEVQKLILAASDNQFSNWRIITEYAFGGYAKRNELLDDFIISFEKENGIPVDPVYTGKMMYGIFDLAERGFFKRGATILAIHTGGVQTNHLF